MNAVWVPAVISGPRQRADVYLRVAARLEEQGSYNLAKVYLQRAVAAERQARR